MARACTKKIRCEGGEPSTEAEKQLTREIQHAILDPEISDCNPEIDGLEAAGVW
jgi:hypothetical protein